MFNSSPIDAWEGAGAIFNSAGSGGVFWCVRCVGSARLCVWAPRRPSITRASAFYVVPGEKSKFQWKKKPKTMSW